MNLLLQIDEWGCWTKLYLRDFNLKEGEAFHYLYDFGDSWEHLIEVESIIEEAINVPRCINGAMACPPEDCGGIWGYQDLVKTIKDPSHPDYEGMLEWTGDDFDPTIFSLNTVDAELKHFGNYHNAHPEDISTPWHQIDGNPEDISNMEDFLTTMFEQINDSIRIDDTSPNPAIDNLSALDMQKILYETFSTASPVGFKEPIDSHALEKIPFLNLVLAYLERLEKVGEMKLTAKGNLPRKWCLELYDLGFIKESYIERGVISLNREADSLTIQHTKLICDLAGITKKRKNNLSLTTKGKKLLKTLDKSELFQTLFLTNLKDFNFGYYDGYEDNGGVQESFGYTLYLLLRYGNEEKEIDFYVDKNIQAFPDLPIRFRDNWGTPRERYLSCYNIRIFERFLCLYGLVNYQRENNLSDKKITLKASEIFNQLFEIRKERFSFSKSQFES